MKNIKYVFGVIAIGFCILSISTRALAADSQQPPWRTTVWPPLSSTQWYWYEPQTNLTVEQVEAIFNETAADNVSLIDTRCPHIDITVKGAKLSVGRPKHGKKAALGSSGSEQVAIIVDSYWEMAGKRSGTEPAYELPLNGVQKMSLHYVASVSNKWCLKMTTADGSRDLYVFYFKDEDFARRFGNAVASILAQKGINQKFSKLGLFPADLTPAQAEALGKTRIDNVLVTIVAIDGPADKANVQPLDVITEVDGVKVRNLSHFYSLLEGVSSGTKTALTCLRRTEVVEKDQKQFDWKPIVIEVTAR